MTPQVTHNKKGVQTMHRNRVKVTLNDDAAVALRRVSLASGESMSGIIASLLDPHVEALMRMSDWELAELEETTVSIGGLEEYE